MRLAVLALFPIAALTLKVMPLSAQGTERTVFVSVLDENGAPVQGLGPDAFAVREDGRAAEVVRVSRATQPIDLAMLVDNSQAAEQHLLDVRSAIEPFVARMAKAGNNVAIIGLADRPTILQDYTNNPVQAAKGVGRIFAQPGSGTTLLDAIGEVSRGLRKREAERRAMLVITTEGTDFSTPNYSRALDAIKESGASFNVLVLTRRGGSDLSTDEARSRAIVFDQGPRNSGGRRTDLLSSMSLKSELDKVATEFENQYAVVYARPESLIPPEKIEVSVTRPGATVRATPAASNKPPAGGE